MRRAIAFTYLILYSAFSLLMIVPFTILADIKTALKEIRQTHNYRLEIFNTMLKSSVCRSVDLRTTKHGRQRDVYFDAGECVSFQADYNLEYEIGIGTVFHDTVRGNCTHMQQTVEMFQYDEELDRRSYRYFKTWSPDYIDSDNWRGLTTDRIKYRNPDFIMKPYNGTEQYEKNESTEWDRRAYFVHDMTAVNSSLKVHLNNETLRYGLNQYQSLVSAFKNYNRTCIQRSLGNIWYSDSVHMKTSSQLESLYSNQLKNCINETQGGLNDMSPGQISEVGSYEPEIGDYRFTAICLGREAPHRDQSRLIGSFQKQGDMYGFRGYKGTDLSPGNNQRIMIWNGNIDDETIVVIQKEMDYEIASFLKKLNRFRVKMVITITITVLAIKCWTGFVKVIVNGMSNNKPPEEMSNN